MQSGHSGLQLTTIKEASEEGQLLILLEVTFTSMQDPSWLTAFQPSHAGEPKLWRLTREDGSGAVEEVVAAIQGIICKKDMPPFEERIR